MTRKRALLCYIRSTQHIDMCTSKEIKIKSSSIFKSKNVLVMRMQKPVTIIQLKTSNF